ncbi:MAG: hypothetical protein ABIO70_33540 [Pseudomonadota bacterium]
MARKNKKTSTTTESAVQGFDDFEADFFATGEDDAEGEDLGWSEEWDDGVPGADGVSADFEAFGPPEATAEDLITEASPPAPPALPEPIAAPAEEPEPQPAEAFAPEEPVAPPAPVQAEEVPALAEPEAAIEVPPAPPEPLPAAAEPASPEVELVEPPVLAPPLASATSLSPDEPGAGLEDDRPNYAPATVRVVATDPPAELESVVEGPPQDLAPEARAWWYAAASLEREAAVAPDPETRAARLAAAASVHRDRVGDWPRAEALYRAARAAGRDDADLLRDLSDLVATREDFAELAKVLEERADLLDDPKARAEAYQDAALVARNNLRNDDDAVRLLDLAVKADHADYFSLRLLRDMYLRLQIWSDLPEVLLQMAALAPAALAAEYHVERGQVYESRLNDDAGALSAFLDARAADPTYGPAFMALERYYRRTEGWVALAELYEAEATQSQGPEAQLWQVKAAHVWWTRVDDPERAAACYGALREAGMSAGAAWEYRAFLSANGKWDQLATLLDEGAVAGAQPSAFDLFSAGRIRESRLDGTDAALTCYLRAIGADPMALPALEGALRILGARGDRAEQARLLESVLPAVEDPELAVTLHFLLAEIYEHGLARPDAARAQFEAVLQRVPSYLPALDGLERVLHALGERSALASIHEQRAELVDDPEHAALQLTLAGLVWDGPCEDPDAATRYLMRALDAAPNHPVALAACTRLLRQQERWSDLAGILRAAAQASRDGDEAVGLWYVAGRYFDLRLDDHDAAMACYRGALELSPGFLPARVCLRALLLAEGDEAGAYGLLRAEADATADGARKGWQLYHALLLGLGLEGVDTDALLESLSAAAPEHAASTELKVCLALHRTDRTSAAEAMRQAAARAETSAESSPLWIHAAHLLAEQGDGVGAMQAISMVLGSDDVAGQPMIAVARQCEALGDWDEAALALALSTEPAAARYLGRIRELYLHDLDGALVSYRQAVDVARGDLVAWLGIERLLTAANDHAALAAVHASLVENTETPAIRGLHGLLGAHLFEGIGDEAHARSLYEQALEARPGRGKAFDGLLRVLIALGDGAGIKALFASVGVEAGLDLANALMDVGELEAALEALVGALDTAEDQLPILLHQERVLADLGRWQEVFEVLGERRRITVSNDALAWIEREQRRLLAGPLAGTDDAWLFYKMLYEERPDDQEVLEALAHISQARGETDSAIMYLEQRAAVVGSDAERVHVHRLVADIYLQAGDGEHAREAFLQALAIDPEDLQSLDGLEAIAVEAGDWSTVVGILARKGVLFEGEEQVETYARIARIWDTELGDPGIAVESWRKVIELDEQHREALDRLVALSEEGAGWSSFVEYGQAMAKLLTGAERSTLLRRIGLVYEGQLHSVQDALRFLEAASAEPAPDADAARARERIHTERGEWEQVIKSLLSLARATEGEEKEQSLLKAARLRATTLHNRSAASEIYAMVIEVAPENAEALRFQCEQLFGAQDYAGAVGLFERLEPIEAQRDLDDFDEQIEVAQFYFHFGETLRFLGRHAEAVSRYEHTLQLNDTHLPSLEALGPLYMEARDWKNGEIIYRKLLQLTGGRGDPAFLAGIYTQLGHIQRHQGDLDKAKKRFNKALELRQNDVPALLGLAAVQYDCGEWSALLNVYNNVIFHARERAEVIGAYLAKGYVLDRKHNLPEKAADHYRKSLNFDPDEPHALLLLGELTLRRKDWGEAARLFEQALATPPAGVALQANLRLALAAARLGAGDQGPVPELLSAAVSMDVTLGDTLATADPTSVSDLIAVLRDRLLPPGM